MGWIDCSFSKVNLIVATLIALCLVLYVVVNVNIGFVAENKVERLSVDNDFLIDLWFLAIKDNTAGHITYAKQAILSAKDKTSLIPIVMLDGKNDNLEKWMIRHDVLVVHLENHPMMTYLIESKLIESEQQGVATWQRIVMPYIVHMLNTDSASDHKNMSEYAGIINKKLPFVYSTRKIQTDYILYTDADVLFINPFKLRRHDLPRYVGMAIQGDRYCCGDKYSKQMHSNAGVLIMNVTGYAEVYEEFIAYIKKHEEYIRNNALDQTALQGFFPQQMKSLTLLDYVTLALYHNRYFHSLRSKYHASVLPKTLEWEPYLGYNENAIILHWHGIKYKTPETLCPQPGADLDYETIAKRYDPSKIRQYLNESHPISTEKLATYKILLRNNFEIAQHGLKIASDVYFTYLRRVCESNVEVKQL